MKIFWAWQSDLPGKVCRHFVRDALLAAIDKLKEQSEIEEPSEESRRNDIHLDSDRQGMSGSPDLAAAILAKIEVSSVFVGDVTPVGKGAPTIADDGTEREGKPLMNPNVAIELGYALAKLTDARILMILNTAYGKRDGLPFDIQHKGGPLMYHLPGDASKKEIEAEKKILAAKLAEALHPFKPTEPTPLEFQEAQPCIGTATFFSEDEVLAKSNIPDHPNLAHKMSSQRVLYLRIIPSRELPRPLPVSMLRDNALRFGAFGECEQAMIRENDFGVITFCPTWELSIGSLTQYFRNGEVWGINADVFSEGTEVLLGSRLAEGTFADSLLFYTQFLETIADVQPPFTVEAGLHGVKGAILCIDGAPFRNAKFAKDAFHLRRTLADTSKSARDQFLIDFFKLMHDQTGHPRPDGLYGFPSN